MTVHFMPIILLINAKVLSAIAEGNAIFNGEKQAKWYTSL